MMGTGAMIRRMGLGSTHIRMGRSMRATGSTTNNMEKEKRSGLMVHNMKVTTKVARKTDMVSSCGLINQAIPVNSTKTIFMVKASIAGRMDESTTVNGLKIKCKDVGYLLGRMVDGMRVNITMTKKKVVVASSGLMAAAMTGIGGQVIKRALAYTIMPRAK